MIFTSFSIQKIPSGEKTDICSDVKVVVDRRNDPSESAMWFALIEFERPVFCPLDSLIIASRLDADAYIHSNIQLFNTSMNASITHVCFYYQWWSLCIPMGSMCEYKKLPTCYLLISYWRSFGASNIHIHTFTCTVKHYKTKPPHIVCVMYLRTCESIKEVRGW